MEGEAEDRCLEGSLHSSLCRDSQSSGEDRALQDGVHGGMMGAGQATVSLRDLSLILAKTVYFEDQSGGRP